MWIPPFSDMNTMNHLTILLVVEVLLLVQSNTLTCEPFGFCAISINETEFSCGENYENVTRADNLLDLKVFWWVIITILQWKNNYCFKLNYWRILTLTYLIKKNINGLIYIDINWMLSQLFYMWWFMSTYNCWVPIIV